MKIAVVYVDPLVDLKRYHGLAVRFADTYYQFRPTLDHTLYVIFNGGNATEFSRLPFQKFPCNFLHHSNVGWDIGAFQMAADRVRCDLMVCLGAPIHFHQSEWLEQMADAYIENGPALYGCWAYLSPNWHVRTTCFWCPPELLKSYPYTVGNTRASRYEFEHGKDSFTRHVLSAGMDCIMVTRKGCFSFDQWNNHAPGVENSLVLDQHIHQ